MKKINGLVALILAGLLVIPGTFGPASQACAQEGSKPLTEQQYRELQQKRQEQWETLEQIQKRQEDTGGRLQDAVKRRQDAEKRQRDAERKLPEQEQQRGK